jgi:hypothetical protein
VASSYWLEDDDDEGESGIWIGKDGVGLEPVVAPDCDEPPDWAVLLATGTWAFEGGFSPLRHELAHTLIFEPQVCMHIVQFCVWFVTLYCREQPV